MLVLDHYAAADIACATDRGIALRNLLLKGDEVASPSTLRLDLMNAMARFMRMRAVSRTVAEECIELALSTVDTFVPYEELLPEAFSEASRTNLTMGDLLYFCMARRLGATLVTSSDQLRALCAESGVSYETGLTAR